MTTSDKQAVMVCKECERLKQDLKELMAYVNEAKREGKEWYWTGLPLPEMVKMMREALDETANATTA
jgi:hypothetical protein